MDVQDVLARKPNQFISCGERIDCHHHAFGYERSEVTDSVLRCWLIMKMSGKSELARRLYPQQRT
jgi:hypothetical protein